MINPVLLDLNEMEREKSPIFLFPFHSNRVKQDLSFLGEFGMVHIFTGNQEEKLAH